MSNNKKMGAKANAKAPANETLSSIDRSIVVENMKSTSSQLIAGWPPAELPSHVHAWPQPQPNRSTSHEKEFDSESY